MFPSQITVTIYISHGKFAFRFLVVGARGGGGAGGGGGIFYHYRKISKNLEGQMDLLVVILGWLQGHNGSFPRFSMSP